MTFLEFCLKDFVNGTNVSEVLKTAYCISLLKRFWLNISSLSLPRIHLHGQSSTCYDVELQLCREILSVRSSSLNTEIIFNHQSKAFAICTKLKYNHNESYFLGGGKKLMAYLDFDQHMKSIIVLPLNSFWVACHLLFIFGTLLHSSSCVKEHYVPMYSK